MLPKLGKYISVVALYDSYGKPLTINNGAIVNSNQPTILFSGSDGTYARPIQTDGYGNTVIVGAGEPGNPIGGVMSIQPAPNSPPFSFTPTLPSTSVVTNVNANSTNITLLSSNSNRLGAAIFNDCSTGIFYIKLGANATNTSFTIKILPYNYFEVPFGYVGQIDGFWTIPNNMAVITELTL